MTIAEIDKQIQLIQARINHSEVDYDRNVRDLHYYQRERLRIVDPNNETLKMWDLNQWFVNGGGKEQRDKDS